jgi:hypothetical protein
VKASEAPNYRGATIGLLVGYAIKTGCHLALLGIYNHRLSLAWALSANETIAYMFTVNRRRDRIYGPANKAASDEAGMRDCTEFENKDFRYVL